MLGSIATLYLILAVYMLVALGIGLFLSTFADTQQQVMFVAWFIMIVFILMSGFFTPAESMPVWAQRFNVVNPFAYFYPRQSHDFIERIGTCRCCSRAYLSCHFCIYNHFISGLALQKDKLKRDTTVGGIKRAGFVALHLSIIMYFNARRIA